jgi:hypothetical protein
MVEFSMEGGTLILIQSKTIAIPTTTTPSLVATMENLGVDVTVEEIKVITME